MTGCSAVKARALSAIASAAMVPALAFMNCRLVTNIVATSLLIENFHTRKEWCCDTYFSNISGLRAAMFMTVRPEYAHHLPSYCAIVSRLVSMADPQQQLTCPFPFYVRVRTR